MYVCVCRAVTERQIFEAAQAGAKNLKDLKRDLDVTTECGRCASCAKECLRDAHKAISAVENITPPRVIPIGVSCA